MVDFIFMTLEEVSVYLYVGGTQDHYIPMCQVATDVAIFELLTVVKCY